MNDITNSKIDRYTIYPIIRTNTIGEERVFAWSNLRKKHSDGKWYRIYFWNTIRLIKGLDRALIAEQRIIEQLRSNIYWFQECGTVDPNYLLKASTIQEISGIPSAKEEYWIVVDPFQGTEVERKKLIEDSLYIGINWDTLAEMNVQRFRKYVL